MPLSHANAKRFYDRFGRKQDTQAFYEDAALTDLIGHAAFDQAASVFELGCGTGHFASDLLENHLAPAASYLGIDLSETMIALARQRVAGWPDRAQVVESDGSMRFALADGSVDRVVSTYVLDLLSDDDIHAAIAEARRVLAPNGRLCLASLATGTTFASRMVCSLWSAVSRLHAPLTGGCRPIDLGAFFDQREWSIDYRNTIIQFGIPSEVLIARPAGA